MASMTPEQKGFMGIFFLFMFGVFIFLAILIATVRAWIFKKAGKNPWFSFVPFYGNYILYDFVMDMPWLGLIKSFIFFFVGQGSISIINSTSRLGRILSLINFIIWIFLNYNLAKRFNKGIGFVLGLIFLPFIFYPILAFGKAEYQPIENKTNKIENKTEDKTENK